MRAVFHRHPYLVSSLTLLGVGLSAYALWFASPVVSEFLFPVLVTATLLVTTGRLPQSVWDWAFVMLILLPFVFVALGVLEFLRPILPLILAIYVMVAVRNKLTKKGSHGIPDSRDNHRRV